MVLSNDKINGIISKCAEFLHEVRVRDISYAILSHFYEDKQVAYRCIFGDDGLYDIYINDKAVLFLEKYMQENVLFDDSKDITFEENKAYMLKLKRETEDAMANGEIEKKDGLKILSDISVKLNDKFSVVDTNQEQLIYVNAKYNAICECGRELYIPTKEDLMKEYNLIEKR